MSSSGRDVRDEPTGPREATDESTWISRGAYCDLESWFSQGWPRAAVSESRLSGSYSRSWRIKSLAIVGGIVRLVCHDVDKAHLDR